MAFITGSIWVLKTTELNQEEMQHNIQIPNSLTEKN